MKRNHSRLLIGLCLALCALCAVQWVREAGLRAQIGRLTADVQERDRTGREQEGRLKHWDSEITRLDLRVKELKSAEGTNAAAVTAADAARRKTEVALEQARREIAAYKASFEKQNANLRAQNEAIASLNTAITRQNDLVKQLGEERARLVEQLNARTAEYNAVVEKFNALAKQVGQPVKKE